jgi:hypothetical protein
MGFGGCADEDSGDGAIGEDGVEIVGEDAAGEEGGELLFPVGAFGADIFQPDIVLPEDRIETGHAVDAESDKSIVLLRMKERVPKVLFFSVLIKSL